MRLNTEKSHRVGYAGACFLPLPELLLLHAPRTTIAPITVSIHRSRIIGRHSLGRASAKDGRAKLASRCIPRIANHQMKATRHAIAHQVVQKSAPGSTELLLLSSTLFLRSRSRVIY